MQNESTPPTPTTLNLVDFTETAEVSAEKPASPSPQQIAIALRYDREVKGEAPKITATGRGAIAEQILQLAFATGVKVREDADLAELLSHLEIDSPIPLEAYTAVAEILAYVYRANAYYPARTK
jgi:flagellar biosynthesis protein